MEQWNIEEIRDIKHYYSLREIMKDVYIERMIEQENKRRKIEALENGKNGVELISYDKLQGNTKKEKFMNLVLSGELNAPASCKLNALSFCSFR